MSSFWSMVSVSTMSKAFLRSKRTMPLNIHSSNVGCALVHKSGKGSSILLWGTMFKGLRLKDLTTVKGPLNKPQGLLTESLILTIYLPIQEHLSPNAH